ncbi:MAG: hypothetical protein J2P37_31005, partial [Ktedonobacteraceae bacterium]|nr:hypothetical protein [Ktedonobacteraceae bacterium]
MIAKGQYVKPFYRGKGGKHPIRAAAHLRAHLKYIQYRASGAEEHDQQRTFFSRDREQVTRQEVHADI